MKAFTPGKIVRRVIKIRSSDRAIADAEWVLSFGEKGLGIRRAGARTSETFHLSWRSVIGHAVIHRAGLK